jgi:drug/metabolite transporter (DMT)-like permease
MGIFFGLAAALGWGVGDFCAGYAAQRVGTYRTLFFMQFAGLIGLSIYLTATGQFVHLMRLEYLGPWLWTVLAAFLNIGCSLLFYRAFEIGMLAIVSPIVASYAVVTVVLSLLSGETLSTTHAFGIIAAMAGVLCVATPLSGKETVPAHPPEASAANIFSPPSVYPKLYAGIADILRKHRLPPGVGLAIAASAGYGLLFWLLGFRVTPFLGGVAPVWLIRFITVCTAPIIVYSARQSLKLPRGNAWWFLLGAGTFDTAGYVADTFGLATGQVAIVSVFSSLFSAVTVLLAWIFLGDRLQWSQWIGVLCIFAGIVLVNM